MRRVVRLHAHKPTREGAKVRKLLRTVRVKTKKMMPQAKSMNDDRVSPIGVTL
jgi:hypothetical protein